MKHSLSSGFFDVISEDPNSSSSSNMNDFEKVAAIASEKTKPTRKSGVLGNVTTVVSAYSSPRGDAQCLESDINLNANISTSISPYGQPSAVDNRHLRNHPKSIQSQGEHHLRKPNMNPAQSTDGRITSMAATVTVGYFMPLRSIQWSPVAMFFISGFLIETWIFRRVIEPKRSEKLKLLKSRISRFSRAKDSVQSSIDETSKQTENTQVILQLVADTDIETAVFKEQLAELRQNLIPWEKEFLRRLKTLESSVDIVVEFGQDEEIRELFEVQRATMQLAERIPPLGVALEAQVQQKRNRVIRESQQASRLSELYERMIDMKKVSSGFHRSRWSGYKTV